MRRLGKICLIGLAGLALAAGPARADVVVAGGAPGPTLTAGDAGDELRVTAFPPADAVNPDDFISPETDTPPLWPNEALVSAETLESTTGTRILTGGAVNAAVATVELTFEDGRVLRLPTFDGSAYHGRWAGQMRFFVGEITLPGEDVDDDAAVRMFDASGTVIGVAHSPDVTHTVRVARRRAAGAVVRFSAELTATVVPLPMAPEHRIEGLCLKIAVNSSDNSFSAACADSRATVDLAGFRGCGRVPTTLTGFVPAATRALELRLGSGRRVSLGTRPAPFGRSDRIVVALVPRGEAIRRATAVDGAGHALATADVRVAPPDRRCAERRPTAVDLDEWDASSDDPTPRFGIPPGTEVAAVAPNGRRLLVRDSGEDVCMGIDRLELAGLDCGPPPVNSHSDYVYVDPAHGVVLGTYAAPVSTLELRFRGGGTTRLPATEAAGYTGRYRGAIRFAFGAYPAGKVVSGGALFDAAGRPIGAVSPYGPGAEDVLIAPPRTAVSAAFARVIVGATRAPQSSRTFPCFGLAFAGRRGECDNFYFGDTEVNAVVSCASRRVLLFGVIPRSARGVDIQLASGRHVEPRIAPFPPRLGARAKVFLAVLPRRATPTRLRLLRHHREGDTDTVLLPTRSPARQCGYDFTDFLF